MVKLENFWKKECFSDDDYVAALAQAATDAFERKMTEIQIPALETIVGCAAFLDPAVYGVLDAIYESNNRWGDPDTVS